MRSILLVPLALGGCATASRPTAAVPVVLSGDWRIVAVNGRATPDKPSYNLRLGAYGAAQFGCNIGSGNYRTTPGWLIPEDEWIVTVAGCGGGYDPWWDRRGWEVLTRPATIEQRGTGYRLRNERGSIDIRR